VSGPLFKTPDDAFAVAFAEMQGKLPKIPKTQEANVPTKTGSYTVRYADLSNLTEKLMPLLSVHGFSWSCRPTLTETGAFVLEYELLHSGGGARTGRYPLPTGGTPQALGSAITYGRRYCLAAVVGVAPEDDDDAAAAEAEATARRGTAQRAPRAEAREQARERASQVRSSPPSRPALPGEPDPISPAQRNHMMGLFGKLNIASGDGGRDARLALCSGLLGRDLKTSNDITKVEARGLIDTLKLATEQEDPAAFLVANFKGDYAEPQSAVGRPEDTAPPPDYPEGDDPGQEGPDGREP
jgi:hypothetical protein